MQTPRWTRDELLVCFNFYCRTPFGKLYSSNPDVIRVAKAIGRTPGAVAMKAVNFASFDPAHQKRKVKGLSNASRQDKAIWDEFNADTNRLAQESEEAALRLGGLPLEPIEELVEIPSGPSEKDLIRPVRLLQSFFRRTVLASYKFTCAFCGLEFPALLNASHIIPWNASVELRGDPRNGLCLCTLHDRAFDRCLMSVDTKRRITISPRLKLKPENRLHKAAFLALKGREIMMPEKFEPLKSSLEHHFERFSKETASSSDKGREGSFVPSGL